MMNKYQEALENIKMIVLDAYSNGYDEPKYLKDFYYCECELLQELVDRAAPKPPAFDKSWEDEETKDIYNEDGSINEILCECPNCHKHSIYDFEYGTRFNCCHECGQAIDWSDEE